MSRRTNGRRGGRTNRLTDGRTNTKDWTDQQAIVSINCQTDAQTNGRIQTLNSHNILLLLLKQKACSEENLNLKKTAYQNSVNFAKLARVAASYLTQTTGFQRTIARSIDDTSEILVWGEKHIVSRKALRRYKNRQQLSFASRPAVYSVAYRLGIRIRATEGAPSDQTAS